MTIGWLTRAACSLRSRYGKSAALREHGRPAQKEAATRCIPRMDSGRTKGYEAKQRTFCLHFARGACVAGYDCAFLHHLPTGVDDANNDMLHDIFGREKHRDDRDDNGGTGSYMRSSRTLFVYYGGAAEWGGDRLREMLGRSFGEWGPVEDIHVVPTKCIGFVRYKFRASAEFAKEAMMGQSLLRGGNGNNGGSSGKEALVVRWANDDPNPVAIRRVKREREAEVIDAMQRAEAKMPPEQRLALQQMRLLQRAREGLTKKKKGGGGGDSEDEDDEVNTDPFASYPNTDAQYDERGGDEDEDEDGRGGSGVISGGEGGDGGGAREVGDDDDDVEGTNAAKKQWQRRDDEDDDAGPAKLVAGPLSPSRW